MTALHLRALQIRFLAIGGNRATYDDTGGGGSSIVAAPNMDDQRSHHRHINPALAAARNWVVTMDVRGFSQGSTKWDDYSAPAVGRDALSPMVLSPIQRLRPPFGLIRNADATSQ